MIDELQRAVREAAWRADVRTAVGQVYARLQQRVDDRRPACSASGRCCRFEEYGHRLFVTTIELAAFAWELSRREGHLPAQATRSSSVPQRHPLPVAGQAGPDPSPWDGTGCPFQVDGLCTVHRFRPFGCRMFYCDETATDWQQEQYEHFHGELKRLHDDLNVPYFYVEWRGALRALGFDGNDAVGGG